MPIRSLINRQFGHPNKLTENLDRRDGTPKEQTTRRNEQDILGNLASAVQVMSPAYLEYTRER